MINDRVASLFRILGVPVELYIFCRPLVGRLFSWFMIYVSHECPHMIRVFPSDRWQVCLGFYFMDRFHSVCGFPVDDFHSGKLPVFHFVKMFSYVILCLISVVGGGVSGRW